MLLRFWVFIKLYLCKLTRGLRKKRRDWNVSKQTEANKKWQANNKERAKYLSDRSRARSFIRKSATLEDIEELRILLKEKEESLKN